MVIETCVVLRDGCESRDRTSAGFVCPPCFADKATPLSNSSWRGYESVLVVFDVRVLLYTDDDC